MNPSSRTRHARRVLPYAIALIALVFIGVVYSGMRTPHDSGIRASFGTVSLRLELATTTVAKERGLGGRSDVPDAYGMLFVFDTPRSYGFWMKDMLVPIDIFWLDGKGQVVTIAARVAPETYPRVFYPTAPAQYVLETRAGFAETFGIATGTTLDLKNIDTVSD